MPLDNSTAITLGGVACWDEGATEHLERGPSSNAIRTVRCAWADRTALARYFLGGVQEVAGVNVYSLPQSWPDAPVLVAKSFDVKGEGLLSVGAAGAVASQWAVCKVTFAPEQWKLGDPQAIGDDEIETSTTGVCLSTDGPTFDYDSDNGPIFGGTVPAIEVTSLTYNRTRHFMPAIPGALIASLVDHVNSTPIFGAAAEFVKFKGARSRRQVFAANPAGQQSTWDVTYTFEVASPLSAGWNSLPRKGQVAWQKFHIHDHPGSRLWPLADLNQLFA